MMALLAAMGLNFLGLPMSALPTEAKMAYARNPFLPEPLFRLLALDRNWGVRAQLARNPALPQTVAYLLSEDKDPDVRKELAANPSIPAEVMQKLAKDTEFIVRLFLASNPALSLSLETVEALASDPVRQIREAVASNPHLSAEAYLRIASRIDVDSYLRLLVNPGVPHGVLADLYSRAPEHTVISALRLTAVPLIVQQKLLEKPSPLVRSTLAESPYLAPEVAQILAKGEDMVRYALAQNKSAPREILELLSRDANELVRKEAERTLSYIQGRLEGGER
jgi:hypothetical protein